jgi:hypothetical protein
MTGGIPGRPAFVRYQSKLNGCEYKLQKKIYIYT